MYGILELVSIVFYCYCCCTNHGIIESDYLWPEIVRQGFKLNIRVV